MICGVDEAGRGPVMGPLVVAAVAVEDDSALVALRVRDSKKLSGTLKNPAISCRVGTLGFLFRPVRSWLIVA